MKLPSPFYRVKGSKVWRALGHVRLASMFLTLSLWSACSFTIFFSNSEWKLRGQEGGRGMCSPALVFPDTFLNRTSGRGTFCSGLWCISSVKSCLCIWRTPIWLCGFCRELLYGNNLPSEVVSLTMRETKLGQIEKFCQLGGASPLNLFLSWFCTALVTISECVRSFNRWPVNKEN